MNEFQVAIGESTCAAKLWAAPVTAGGHALLEARELTKLALERSKTAREAVLLMGSLAEKYGFYAADWSGGDDSKGEGGEALTVVDQEEAWVFHILSDDTGKSAVWAAARVPDEHVSDVDRFYYPIHPLFSTSHTGTLAGYDEQSQGIARLFELNSARRGMPLPYRYR